MVFLGNANFTSIYRFCKAFRSYDVQVASYSGNLCNFIVKYLRSSLLLGYKFCSVCFREWILDKDSFNF